jgi:hypothetical protein
MSSIVDECPICMDNIEVSKNCIVTECGHKFHASCLLSSVAHSNFACPCCRYELAEHPEESDDDGSEEEEEDDQEIYQNMRWLFQRAEGEELEEEWYEDDDEYEDEDEGEERNIPVNYIVNNLSSLNYNFEDIVKVLLNDFLMKEQDEKSTSILETLDGLIDRYREGDENVTVPNTATTATATIATNAVPEEKKIVVNRYRNTVDLCGNN